MTAEQERAVVARITMPRRRIGRGRFTEGEAGELDEHVLDGDVAFTGLVQQAGAGAGGRGSSEHGRDDRVVALGTELEVGLTAGAADRVFRGGAGIVPP